MSSYQYDNNFFNFVDKSSGQSAFLFLTAIKSEFVPSSVLDIGCGRGVWLEAWHRLGVDDIFGVDGDYVSRNMLRISSDRFVAQDISQKFTVGRRFDLVECLEVAEHLPKNDSDTLVDNLVNHADIILFSAAQPGQGGEFHVNEQPLKFWMDKFKNRGYEAFDFPRIAVKEIQAIEPWYRYNSILFANEQGKERLSPSIILTQTESDDTAKYSPLLWRMRCKVLSILPQHLIHSMAQIKHRIINMFC